jgi:hypothetical protein
MRPSKATEEPTVVATRGQNKPANACQHFFIKSLNISHRKKRA